MTAKYCIVGGGGYLGYHIAQALVAEGNEVVLCDIRRPSEDWKDCEQKEDIAFMKVDVRNRFDLAEAFEGADCVIHTASYGMSGKEQLNWKQAEDVNITGTKNIIQACCKQGVQSLVYTSTYNVIYGGHPIHKGDETMPYFPLYKHCDHYSRTKSIAEQMVLLANEKLGKEGIKLRTCALRLAGLMGPKEERHLPRIMDLAKRGAYNIKYGSPYSLVEFVSVHNAVQAHIKAAKALRDPEMQVVVGGNSYFISDGEPINNFEFFGRIFHGLGYPAPRIHVPIWLIYTLAYIMELIPSLFWTVFGCTPFLTRAEVFKTGVTHYFTIEKARKHLDYSPSEPNNVISIIEWLKKNGHVYKPVDYPKKMKFMIMDVMMYFIFTSLVFSISPKTAW